MAQNSQNMLKKFQHIPHITKVLKINKLKKIDVLESVRNVLELVGSLKMFQHIPTHFGPFSAFSTPYITDNQYVLDVLEVLEAKSLLRVRAQGTFCPLFEKYVTCH